jgi:2-polyprenyl-6-methoxyphenol hydroxylase-like FAD-dependent oxidoreductase
VRRQLLPDVELVYAGYVGWRGMVDEWTLSPQTHAALFHRFAWGLIPGEHILGYPVPGQDDDLRPGRRRYSFVWYRPVDEEPPLREMQTDAAGRYHRDGIPPQAIRPELIAALREDADALFCRAWAEVVEKADQPLFQPIGDLESPRMAFGRVALVGDAAFVARPHVARGAIKAGHDAMALAAALASAPVASSTSTPPSRSIPGPRPDAFSVGSSEAKTTRAISASRIASVQGGWRPSWAQGSSVTYSVEPAGSSPRSRASAIAARSA